MTAELPVLLAAVFMGAVFVTAGVRHHAMRGAILLDIPNERSSHSRPTPRGGGLGIVLAALAALTWLAAYGWIPAGFTLALGGGMALIAAVGWLDDHRPVPARWRLLVHTFAAAWALAWLAPGWLATPWLAVGLFSLVWLTNLYNFMDGIDGLAGVQAACTAAGGGVLLWLSGEQGLALVAFSLGAACLGFLIWNWPPARIFMGDVGSCTLGLAFGVLAVAGARGGAVPLAAWIILLAPFIVDATLTLARRILRGERWYTAHKSHAYQQMVQRGWSHRRVTVLFLVTDVCFAWPLAWAAWSRPDYANALAAAALAALGGMWWLVERCAHKNIRPAAG